MKEQKTSKNWFLQFFKLLKLLTPILDKLIKVGKIVLKIFLSILLICILMVVLITALNNPETNNEQIENFVKKVNPELKYFSIEKNLTPLFDNDSLYASYIISLDNNKCKNVYFFDMYKYVIETGGDILQIPTADLCTEINNIFYYGDSSYVSTIRKLKTEISLGKFAKFKMGNFQELLTELFISIKGMININRKKVDIYIKGYADGQKADWTRELLKGKYHYDSVIIFPQLDQESINPIEFIKINDTMTVPNYYSNIHLPNLRAKFVKEDLIDPFLKNCTQKYLNLNFWDKLSLNVRTLFRNEFKMKINSYILQGYVYSNPEQPLNRRVQIYINIY